MFNIINYLVYFSTTKSSKLLHSHNTICNSSISHAYTYIILIWVLFILHFILYLYILLKILWNCFMKFIFSFFPFLLFLWNFRKLWNIFYKWQCFTFSLIENIIIFSIKFLLNNNMDLNIYFLKEISIKNIYDIDFR